MSTDRSARHVVSSLGVCTWEDWAQVYCVSFMFRRRPLLFSAVVVLPSFNWRFCVVLLVHKVSRSRFHFWRFRGVYLSLNFLYKLKFWLQSIPTDRRKSITFPFFSPALFLIWDFPSDISSGVYNIRSFVTGAVWLYSEANSHRLGPFDLVFSSCYKGVVVLASQYLSAWIWLCGEQNTAVVSKFNILRMSSHQVKLKPWC